MRKKHSENKRWLFQTQKCELIATYFAAGRTELRVYVLREEQRAMPAYEEPPVLPGGSFFLFWLDFRVFLYSYNDWLSCSDMNTVM